MRPGTQLEKRVHQLSKTQKDLTPAQREWGLSHLIPHYCLYATGTHRNCCVDCGHEWTGNNDRCPNCGKRLTLLVNSRRRRFIERKYYGVIQKVKEFSVIRIFYIYDSRRKGDDSHTCYISEIVQHWIAEDGRCVIRARNLAMCYYYRHCPFSLCSDISIKRESGKYNSGIYHIVPDGYYPRMSHSPILKRNGFNRQFHGFHPEHVFTGLLSDNRFETLWKLGLYEFADKYLRGRAEDIIKYWKGVLGYYKAGMHVNDVEIWFDYLHLLEYFHKDTCNRVYLYPDDLHSAHNRLVDKKTEIEDRLEMERKKQQEKDKLAVLQSKSKYFDITFNDGRIMVIVLKSLEEYRDEAKYQHHCVYTNSYYGKKNSIVLSARMMDSPDIPVETVELSLKDGRILQCFGKCNKFTEYHQQVIDLVKKNSRQFLHKH